MPFYIRTRPRRPLWYPAAWGAGLMLTWAVGQVVLLARATALAGLSVLHLVLYVVAFTVVAGVVAGAVSWALATTLFRRLPALRLITGTVGAGICLTTLTLAASLAVPGGPWSRVNRATFMLSTGLLSLILGWVIANDPFGLARTTTRVYLSPADFASLPPSEQAHLQPDAAASAGPVDQAGAG